MAESHKKSKQADSRKEEIPKESKREDGKKENSGKKNSRKEESSKNIPAYDKNEKWVQDHIKEFGEEPGFF